jgi:predicted transposase YbfD/YdcC
VLLHDPVLPLPPECRAAQPVAAMGVLPVKRAKAESLFAAFGRVPDPRARNSHHRRASVLTITALAILMGRQRPADFVRLAQQLNARQRQALGYYRPPGKKLGVAPGSDVFYTLLGRVDPAALAAVLNDWLHAQHGQLPQALALDGKAVTDRLAQVVSLVAQETGATVALAPVLSAAKEHEVPAARALLAATDLTATLVSLDAGHANHAIARTIVSAGGEYLLQLKGNAPTVQAAAAHAVLGAAPLFSTDDCDHGRVEHRALTLATVTPEQLGFPHAATVVAVTSAVTHKQTGATSGEIRHFVSSLERGALTPPQWLARVRGHWRVESANHYRRDVTWREDQELGRNARRACNLALLRSALLGVILRDGSRNLSALTQHYASHPAAAQRFLFSSRPI